MNAAATDQLSVLEVALVRAVEDALMRVAELEATLAGVAVYATSVRARVGEDLDAVAEYGLQMIDQHCREVLAGEPLVANHHGEEGHDHPNDDRRGELGH